MKQVEVGITGVTPLLVNRFHEEAQESATSGIRTRKEHLGPKEDAELKLYRNEHSEPYFPSENLRQSMISAAARSKIGRRSAQSDAAAALYLEPYCLPILGEWEVDARPVVIRATGGRIVRYRPIFKDWSLRVRVNVDTDLLPLGLARKILDDAGNYVGIGDFRPQRKGPYGRFRVDGWNELDEVGF